MVMTKECSTIIQRNLPTKKKNLGSFQIPCTIGDTTFGQELIHDSGLLEDKQSFKFGVDVRKILIIINNLDAMGKHHSEEDLIRKVLRSLTKQWETKSIAISERHDIIKITYDELRGKLFGQDSKKNTIAFIKSKVSSKE
ncbi:hypothetical protein PIB30_056473 [Stylosanthes scabra]|uniref:UBN2 domain-containing protein n=1 Tax=Stylosanthes scabra TaxID=79078 RepID=A0ABU6ZI12_9FABA|nr:hypothetical protein [Stylosanthes scabra]